MTHWLPEDLVTPQQISDAESSGVTVWPRAIFNPMRYKHRRQGLGLWYGPIDCSNLWWQEYVVYVNELRKQIGATIEQLEPDRSVAWRRAAIRVQAQQIRKHSEKFMSIREATEIRVNGLPRRKRLTPSEVRILALLFDPAADAESSTEIAAVLKITKDSVDHQLSTIYSKLGVKSFRGLFRVLHIIASEMEGNIKEIPCPANS